MLTVSRVFATAISKEKSARRRPVVGERLRRQSFPRLRRSALRHFANCSGSHLVGVDSGTRAPGDGLDNSCGRRRRFRLRLCGHQKAPLRVQSLHDPRLGSSRPTLSSAPRDLATARNSLATSGDHPLIPRLSTSLACCIARAIASRSCSAVGFRAAGFCDKTAASVFQLLILEELLLRGHGVGLAESLPVHVCELLQTIIQRHQSRGGLEVRSIGFDPGFLCRNLRCRIVRCCASSCVLRV